MTVRYDSRILPLVLTVALAACSGTSEEASPKGTDSGGAGAETTVSPDTAVKDTSVAQADTQVATTADASADAGAPTVVDAGAPAVVDAGAPAVVDAGAPVVVDAGTPTVVDAGTTADTASSVPGDVGSVADIVVPSDAGGGKKQSQVPAAMAMAGLQYHGGVGFLRKMKGQAAHEFVEISAPILPALLSSVGGLYAYEGSKLPKTQAGLEKLAHDVALTYDTLLNECKKSYPGIILQAKNATKPLTTAELSKNYDLVGECAYKKFKSKPYWIPKIVDKVDLCGIELGPDWLLLSEEDVASLTKDQSKIIVEAVTSTSGKFFGKAFFSMHVYVRASSGLLMLGTLNAGSKLQTVESAGNKSGNNLDVWTHHLEGSWVPRCIRVRGVKK